MLYFRVFTRNLQPSNYTEPQLELRAFFNYITTGAFTPVGPLLAPVVKHDFQMNWALLIISKRLTLLRMLHLPAFSYPLTLSTLISSYKSRQGRC